MKKAFLVLALSCSIPTLFAPGVHACGDKFLVVGRGARYARTGAFAKPASVLVFRNVSPGAPMSPVDLELQMTLTQAGHRFKVASGFDEMDQSLKSESFDIVLADLAEASEVEKRLEGMVKKPAVLPIVYSPVGADSSAAKKQYGAVVKNPEKPHQLLDAIDQVMSWKNRS